MATEIWVNIGLGNGLLPDGTKPLPEPMLAYHQWGPKTFTWKKFHERYPNHQSLKWTWKPFLNSPRGQWVKSNDRFWCFLCCLKTFTHVYQCMMTSSNGNIFRVTGPLCGDFTGPQWNPRTKASSAELWCFRISALKQTVEQTIVRLVIWDAILPIMTSL